MASTRRVRYRLNEDLVRVLEGDLAQLRERARLNPVFLPDITLPGRYIEALTEVPSRVIQQWLRDSTAPRASDVLRRFSEIYSHYVALFASRYEKNVQTIACDPGNRNSLAANLKILDWLGEEERRIGEATQDDIGGIPADLAAELTDEELAEYEAREEEDQRRAERDALVLERLRARKAQRRLAESGE